MATLSKYKRSRQREKILALLRSTRMHPSAEWIYQRLKKESRIVDEDWQHYNTAHVVYEPRHMSREELYAGYLWMYDRFYALENILRRMPAGRRRLPYLLFNLGYRKYGKVTSQVARLGLMNALGRAARRVAYGIA